MLHIAMPLASNGEQLNAERMYKDVLRVSKNKESGLLDWCCTEKCQTDWPRMRPC